MILLDTMWAGVGVPPNPKLLARNAYMSMIETAQNVADRYGLTREEIDAFALRSQQHTKVARDSGRLGKEIMPVQIAATKKHQRTRSRMTSLSATTPPLSSWRRCRYNRAPRR